MRVVKAEEEELDEVGEALAESASSRWRVRVVMRVLMTQMGFVMMTVAEPARAPAKMDSRAVSFLREWRSGLVKNARAYSYQ